MPTRYAARFASQVVMSFASMIFFLPIFWTSGSLIWTRRDLVDFLQANRIKPGVPADVQSDGLEPT